MSLFDRVGVRQILILLTAIPLAALVAISALLVSDANERAQAAESCSAAIHEAVAIGRLRSVLLVEGVLYDLWGIESVSEFATQAGTSGTVLVDDVRTAVDDALARVEFLDLDAATRSELNGITEQLSDLRSRWDAVDRQIGDETGEFVERISDFESERTRIELIGAGGAALSIVLFEDFSTSLTLESRLASRILIEGNRSTELSLEHQRAATLSDARYAFLLESLPDDSAEQLRALVDGSSLREMRSLVSALPVDGEATPLQPFIAAALLAQGSADTDALYVFGTTLVDQAESAVAAEHDSARMSRLTVVFMAIGGVFVSLVASRFVGGRLTGRLERVASVARSISGGELDTTRINDAGDDEVTELAVAVDDMSTTLSVVQRQLGALADEQYDDPVLETELPGTVGRNLRTAVRRVTNTAASLHTRANTDPLTGLLNRTSLEEKSLERTAAPVVAMIDLDGFKKVNDTHGHAAGDDVLVRVARLLETLSPESDLIARVGGDEFVITSWGTLADVEERTQALVAAVTTSQRFLGIGCSVGVVPGTDGEAFESIVQRADAAMYEAKRSGGRTFIVAA